MSDPITQMRLSMRLEKYLSEYMQKNRDTSSSKEWDAVWHVADDARTDKLLTPEIVDNVRIALNKIGNVV